MTKTYVITGATSGIGKATVDALCGENIVFVGYRNELKLKELNYDSHITIEREIDGEQQLEDVLYARNYLQNIISEVFGGELKC